MQVHGGIVKIFIFNKLILSWSLGTCYSISYWRNGSTKQLNS